MDTIANYRIPIYKIMLIRDGSIAVKPTDAISNSATVVEIVRAYLAGVDREHCIILMLDSKNKMIGINTISVGSLSSSIAHPREVFKPAILCNAAAIIIAHNHPSGDPTPSHEDRIVTDRLFWAGELLGIRLLDHIVIGEPTHFSFADTGSGPFTKGGSNV